MVAIYASRSMLTPRRRSHSWCCPAADTDDNEMTGIELKGLFRSRVYRSGAPLRDGRIPVFISASLWAWATQPTVYRKLVARSRIADLHVRAGETIPRSYCMIVGSQRLFFWLTDNPLTLVIDDYSSAPLRRAPVTDIECANSFNALIAEHGAEAVLQMCGSIAARPREVAELIYACDNGRLFDASMGVSVRLKSGQRMCLSECNGLVVIYACSIPHPHATTDTPAGIIESHPSIAPRSTCTAV